MSLDVVRHQMGSTEMTVVVRDNKSPENLTSRETREAVLNWARAQGFPARGLKQIPGTYPVDAQGKTDDDLVLGKRPIAGWQADFELSAGLG